MAVVLVVNQVAVVHDGHTYVDSCCNKNIIISAIQGITLVHYYNYAFYILHEIEYSRSLFLVEDFGRGYV